MRLNKLYANIATIFRKLENYEAITDSFKKNNLLFSDDLLV